MPFNQVLANIKWCFNQTAVQFILTIGMIKQGLQIEEHSETAVGFSNPIVDTQITHHNMSVLPNTNSSATEEDSTKVVSKQVLLLQGSETKLFTGEKVMFIENLQFVKNLRMHWRSLPKIYMTCLLYCVNFVEDTLFKNIIYLDLPFTCGALRFISKVSKQ